jgi:hypothetical protein
MIVAIDAIDVANGVTILVMVAIGVVLIAIGVVAGAIEVVMGAIGALRRCRGKHGGIAPTPVFADRPNSGSPKPRTGGAPVPARTPQCTALLRRYRKGRPS